VTYEIYCPCRVDAIGPAKVDGLLSYFVEPWIHAQDKRAGCKHCGEIVRVVGCDCQQCKRPLPAAPTDGKEQTR
jgi:hypothetical protein